MADLAGLLGRSRGTTVRAARPATVARSGASARDGRLAEIQRNRDLLAGNRQPLNLPAKPISGSGGPRRAPSFMGQLGRAITGVPQGVAGLVSQAAVTSAAPFRTLFDLTTKGELRGDGFMGGMAEYAPLADTMARSFGATTERVVPMAWGDFSGYQEASDEGRIVDALLEDIGNVGMAGGAASKLLGRTARTVAVPNRAVQAAVEGSVPMRAAGAATLAEAAAPIIPRRLVRPRAVGAAGEVIEMSTPATVRGTGLAGVAERAGYGGTARALDAASRGTRSVARLGEAVDNTQFALPLRAIGMAARPVTSRIGRGVQAAAVRAAQGEGRLAQFAEGITPEGRAERALARQARDAVPREVVAAQRRVIEPAQIARDLGLDPRSALARAAQMSVDQRFVTLVDTIRTGLEDGTLDAEAAGELVRRAYEGEADVMRPTLDDIQAAIDYDAGRLDERTTAIMDQIAEATRDISSQRTEQVLAERQRDPERGIDPQQVGNEMLDSVRDKERATLERRRDQAQRQWEGETGRAARAVRMADAREAINAELPPPPSFQAGQRAGVAQARADAMRREHARTVADLGRAVAAYEKVADSTPEALRQAERNVDRLTERAVALEAELRRVSRRRDAVEGLSRASGEVRRVDGDAPVRPEVDLSDVETPAEIKRAAGEIAEREASSARAEVERIAGGDVPQISGEWAELAKIRPAERIKQYTLGRFLGSAKKGTGLRPDQFAVQVGGRIGRSLDTAEALELYFRAVDNYLDTKARASDVAVTEIAQATGLPPEAVRAAITGSAADYRAMMADVASGALDDVRAAYLALDEADRAILNDEIGRMVDAGAPASEFADLLFDFFGEMGDGADVLAPIWNTASMDQVAAWLRGGEVPESFYVAVTRRRGPAQQRQVGRMAGEVAGTRRQLGEVYRAQRGARQTLDAAEREAGRAEARAGRAVEQAGRREVRAGELADAAEVKADALDAAPDGQPWKRRGDALSPAERALVQQGALRNEATSRQARVARLRRSVDRWNDRIANLDSELGRTFQDRLREDVNAPAVGGFRRSVRSAGRAFGSVMMGRNGRMRLTGVAGRIADDYGLMDEVVAALDDFDAMDPTQRAQAVLDVFDEAGVRMSDVDVAEFDRSWMTEQLLADIDAVMSGAAEAGTTLNAPFRVADVVRQSPWLPDDIKSQVEAKLARYEKRRASFLGRLMDAQAEAMPARFRAVGANARRQVSAMLEMAEEMNRRSPGSGDGLLQMVEDVPTALAQFVEAGIDPVHLIGGDPVSRPRTGGGGRGLSTGKLRAEKRLAEGLRPLDLDQYARLEADQAAALVVRNAATYITETFGRRVDDVLAERMTEWQDARGEPMPAAEMRPILDEMGWTAAPGEQVAGGQTLVIPKAVADELRSMGGAQRGKLMTALAESNRLFKMAVLPLSPKWLTGNIVGNAFMATFNGGLGPVELARSLQRMASMQGGWRELIAAKGMPAWAPDELASHGLAYGDHQLMWGGLDEAQANGRLMRLIERSYNLNEMVDNMMRSAVYLAKISDGVPTEAAMRHTLNAMGDFTRMTPFERRVVREVLPFYAWLRHQTQATLRLPLTSPTRAAFLWHLTSLYSDPEFSEDMLAMMGSRIPLGDRLLNLGGLSPFGDPFNTPLDPSAGNELFRAISPGIKLPFLLAAGVDLSEVGPMSRPTDQRPRNLWGQEEPRGALRRILGGDVLGGLGEAAYVTAGQVPQTRALRDIALDPSVARYDSGDRVGRGQYDDESRTRLGQLVRALNLPTLDNYDPDEWRRLERQRSGR